MRSDHDRAKGENQRVQSASQQRVDELGLLEAILAGSLEADLLDQGRRFQPDQVASDVREVCQRAWAFFSNGTPEQIACVRGCSPDMVALGARMARILEQLIDQHEAVSRRRNQEREAARGALEAAFERAAKLRDQARRILAKVAVSAATKTQLNNATVARSGNGSLEEALRELATIARSLIDEKEPVQQKRVQLFSLDTDYLDALDVAAQALHNAEKAFAKLDTPNSEGDGRILWCTAVGVTVVQQVLDAFLVGHEIDPSIPLIRPTHLNQLMPELSLLPPPLKPKGLGNNRLAKKGSPKINSAAPNTRRHVSQPPPPPRRIGSRTGPFKRGD